MERIFWNSSVNKNISLKSAAPDSQSLKSIGCFKNTLPGNVLPRISQLTFTEDQPVDLD
jgi:hypothetical protein